MKLVKRANDHEECLKEWVNWHNNNARESYGAIEARVPSASDFLRDLEFASSEESKELHFEYVILDRSNTPLGYAFIDYELAGARDLLFDPKADWLSLCRFLVKTLQQSSTEVYFDVQSKFMMHHRFFQQVLSKFYSFQDDDHYKIALRDISSFEKDDEAFGIDFVIYKAESKEEIALEHSTKCNINKRSGLKPRYECVLEEPLQLKNFDPLKDIFSKITITKYGIAYSWNPSISKLNKISGSDWLGTKNHLRIVQKLQVLTAFGVLDYDPSLNTQASFLQFLKAVYEKECADQSGVIDYDLKPSVNSQIGKDHIYMLREREFFNSGKPIYKIGRTGQLLTRMNKYPKDSEIILSISVIDASKIEGEIKKALIQKNFLQRREYGVEYFEGNDLEMRDIIMKVVASHDK